MYGGRKLKVANLVLPYLCYIYKNFNSLNFFDVYHYC
ncbi:hypothetical protein J2T04_003206 [Chryseobacterium lathyri]|uniref:Uncharacterized protein n=1 Tax=Chryseobacterium lathyri TaxID=395933 RepID=A0ABT9SPD0_9FLAO|nr:hypothetical protein [Chryseobacterium lathyri]MDQ0067969.1 hypothetical protein [Chryseobacterium lathyri]